VVTAHQHLCCEDRSRRGDGRFAASNYSCKVHLTLWEDSIVPEAVSPLTHLESLTIRDRECPGTQKLLLDAPTAPALRQLTISEYELGDEPISTITSFLTRSHCSLNSLRVSHSSLQEADYCALFPSINVIEVSTLDVDDSSDDNDEDWEDEDSDESHD
jgi:hypothetical protein